ncbi:MAG: rRNA pseudouridine synthase [Clostridia bacterium]|nr:rRNA pseudouridine synthase [Clostridia bacterium]
MARDTRLQKMMADCGVASRRKAEEMITDGRVKVNGKIAAIGDKVDPEKDVVIVDGERLRAVKSKKSYIMLHKPRGFITTMSDEKDRKCVADLISDLETRLFPIGRLDKDSEGLLLLTNDGAFANMISHPSGHVSKVYRVTVKPAVTEDILTSFAVGITVDGEFLSCSSVKVLTQEKGRVVLEIVLNEGKNRQIRRMCEYFGLEVARLKRISVGGVKLGMLQPGQYRDLTAEEVKRLKTASQKARERNESLKQNSGKEN